MSQARMLEIYGVDEDELSQTAGHELIPSGTNNSMPLADKPYDPPELPEEIHAYSKDLGSAAKLYRESYKPVRRNYVNIFIRVRRSHYEPLLWQLITAGIMSKEGIYSPQCLPYWTVGLRIRLRNNYPMGKVIDAMKSRLGITNPGIRFCLDGFFGMVNYGDIFGNTADACPWMEISNFSTVESLRLKDSDSIFVSVASAGQIENVMKWRKKQTTDSWKQAPDSKAESDKGFE